MMVAEGFVDEALAALARPGAEKFRVAKALVARSEREPESLYPAFEKIRALMDSENNIIKWTALQIIANLAPVDEEGRIEKMIGAYLAPIRGPALITAAHAIAGAARIAKARPGLGKRIVRAILGVAQAKYQTEECRNIAIGHAITALGTLDEATRRGKAVLAFVTGQRGNTRPATRKKAEGFLKSIRRDGSPPARSTSLETRRTRRRREEGEG